MPDYKLEELNNNIYKLREELNTRLTEIEIITRETKHNFMYAIYGVVFGLSLRFIGNLFTN